MRGHSNLDGTQTDSERGVMVQVDNEQLIMDLEKSRDGLPC